MAYKKTFVAGDKLLASELTENFTDLEPIDAYEVKTAGYLTGGDSPSALSVFNALAQGDNDGKFDITIDGQDYNDVLVNLASRDYTPVNKIEISGNTERRLESPHNGTAYGTGQTITIPSGMTTLEGFSVQSRSNSGGVKTWQFEIWDTPDRVGGTLLGSQGGISIGAYGGTGTFTLSTPIEVEAGDTFYCHIYPQSGGDVRLMYGTNTYTGGQMYTGATPTLFSGGNADFNIKVQGEGVASFTSFADIATKIQKAIRAVTGESETVEYDTDHFKITSTMIGSDSNVSQLSSPSTGTDISGAGATAYLDCASNAVATQGTTPTGGKVIKTASDGKVDPTLVKGTAEYSLPTSGKLICAEAGAKAIFDALGAGSNNGKISVNIDGTAHSNIDINLAKAGTVSELITNSVFDNGKVSITPTVTIGQSFKTGSTQKYITRIDLYQSQDDGGGVTTLEIFEGADGTGTLLHTETWSWGTGSDVWRTKTLSSPVLVNSSSNYHFKLTHVSGGDIEIYSNNDYADGQMYTNGVAGSVDLNFKIWGANVVAFTDMDEVAEYIEDAIQEATSGEETVIYDTDHFEISSGNTGEDSSVSFLTTPSSGTDLGTATYLNGKEASGVNEKAGTDGSAEQVVQTGENGRVSEKLINVCREVILSANDNEIEIDFADIPLDRFKLILFAPTFTVASGNDLRMRVNDDTGSNYNSRRQNMAGSVSNTQTGSYFVLGNFDSADFPQYIEIDFINYDGVIKIGKAFFVEANTSGANDFYRTALSWKTLTGRINKVKIYTTESTGFGIGTRLILKEN